MSPPNPKKPRPSPAARPAPEATARATEQADPAHVALLEAHLPARSLPDLAGASEGALDLALRELVKRHGVEAVPLVRRMADDAADKAARKVARRALYRLTQAGVSVPPSAAALPAVVRRERERATRAWLSGIDGSGSRAAWIIFEGGVGGGLRLCSLILNDEAGILEAAGGPITRRRLDAELASLRQSQKLPWIDAPPERARALVAEALAVHDRAGTRPPPQFARWRALFESAPAPEEGDLPAPEPAMAERAVELLELPELMGWFVDPAAIQEESMARLEMQDSRLIVSEQIKAEREAAIVDRAIAKAFTPDARGRWARRLREMARVFQATDRAEAARLAVAAAAAMADEAQPAERVAVARGLAMRGLEVAGEVALGRVRLADVSREPRAPRGGPAPAPR